MNISWPTVPPTEPGYRPSAEIVSRVFPPSESEQPKTLYHYTDQKGLVGILGEKKLWVSSIRYLNDAAELRYAAEITQNKLAQSRDGGDSAWSEACKDFSSHVGIGATIDRFVGSFSEQPDLLSQWRAYSGGGVGFSVGFDFDRLQALANQQGFTLQKCAYESSEQDRIAEYLIAQCKKELKEKGKEAAEGFYFAGFVALAPSLKHPTFLEEREWRLVGDVAREEIRFRMGRSMLIPYGEFRLFDGDGTSPISEVIVGPTPHADLSRGSVLRLLEVNALHGVSVRTSSVPYRNW